MSDKFQNKYRIPSARLQNWDYGSNALYFITICTKSREHYFGKIVMGTTPATTMMVQTQNFASLPQPQPPPSSAMQLTTIGKQVEKCWYEIPQHFPFVVLDEFVVMPNHIHGILIFNKQEPTPSHAVETQNFASLPTPTPISNTKNKFGPQSKNLASIVRGVKIGVTKYARSKNIDFGWQSRFHDHIIRNDESYRKIKNYIRNNPQNWDNDKFKH